jgi:hypothetical protein
MLTTGLHTSKTPTRCSLCRSWATDEQTKHPKTEPRPQVFLDGKMICDECALPAAAKLGPTVVELFRNYEQLRDAINVRRGNIWSQDPEHHSGGLRSYSPGARDMREVEQERKAARAAARERVLERLIDEELGDPVG